MKPYYRLAIALVVPLLMTVVARRAQIGARPAEPQRGTATGAAGQAAEAQPSQEPPARGGRGTPAGTAGPATELLKLMAVDKPDFGIKVVRTFDASGKPAYETKGGDLLFITNASVSYNSTADKPMIIVINAKARKIVAVADIDMPSTPHGITLSPDAKYIYLPSGPSTATVVRGRAEGFFGGPGSFGAPTAVVDTKTLKLVALIEPGGSTHHTH